MKNANLIGRYIVWDARTVQCNENLNLDFCVLFSKTDIFMMIILLRWQRRQCKINTHSIVVLYTPRTIRRFSGSPIVYENCVNHCTRTCK